MPIDMQTQDHRVEGQTVSQTAQGLLSLLHISSPALPVGAFAYSQGLEYALDAGWCKNAQDIEHWIVLTLEQGIGTLDLPVYARIYDAWSMQDDAAVKEWNQQLLAFRETKELYLEDTQVGAAYAQWHRGQTAHRMDERTRALSVLTLPTVVAMSALAAVMSDIPKQQALIGFAWAWSENQIACASKALPLGQTAGQQILQRLIPVLDRVVTRSLTIEDEALGTGLMGLAIASSLHESQYSRLFRS